MIGRIFQVFSYELRRNFRRKGFLFATFGLPLIGFVVLFGYQVISGRAESAPSPTDALDLDLNGIEQAGFVDLTGGKFGDAGALSSVLTRYDDEAAARAALESGGIDVYYIIQPDYMQTGDVTLVMPRLNIGQLEFEPIRRLLLNALARDVPNKTLYERLVNPSTISTVNVSAATAQGQTQGSSFFIAYVFALILLVSVFTTNGYLMQSVIEEKETRLIEILLSTLRPIQLLTGKILALGLLGLVQVVIWLASTLLLARVSGMSGMTGALVGVLTSLSIPTWLLPLLLTYFVLAYLMFAALFGAVGAISNSSREGPQYAAVFTMPAVIPLWFTQIFATAPDGPIPTFLSLFPLTAPLAMVQRLAVSVVPAWQIAVSIVLLALTGIGLMWAAARLFRVQTLLAGQMPRLRDLPGLIRG